MWQYGSCMRSGGGDGSGADSSKSTRYSAQPASHGAPDPSIELDEHPAILSTPAYSLGMALSVVGCVVSGQRMPKGEAACSLRKHRQHSEQPPPPPLPSAATVPTRPANSCRPRPPACVQVAGRVFSFDMLQPEVCERLLQEADHYEARFPSP